MVSCLRETLSIGMQRSSKVENSGWRAWKTFYDGGTQLVYSLAAAGAESRVEESEPSAMAHRTDKPQGNKMEVQ